MTYEIQAKHADYYHHTVILHLTFLTSYDGRVFSEEKMDEKHQLPLNKSISPYLFQQQNYVIIIGTNTMLTMCCNKTSRFLSNKYLR